MNERNPTITINLSPVLEGYCRWVFKASKKNEIKITLNHRIGKHIYSKVQTGRNPDPRTFYSNPVLFALPVTQANSYEFRNKKVYVNSFSEEQINLFIEADFDQWCRHKFEIGYFLNFSQKEIIVAILRIINVRNNNDNFEMIKKKDYRNRRKEEQIRFELLLKDCLLT